MQSHALPTDRVAASEYKTQIFGVSKGKGKGKGKGKNGGGGVSKAPKHIVMGKCKVSITIAPKSPVSNSPSH